MFKFDKKLFKNIIWPLTLIVVLAFAVPAFKQPFFLVLEYPLRLCSLIGNEVKALVFFHRNYAASRRLGRENDLLRRKLVDADECRLENARMKALLDFRDETGYKVIPARIIARDPSNWSSTIIVNKGSSHGVVKGKVVVSFLGLVGRVAEVFSSTSKIVLINDPQLNVSARIQRSRQEGLVCGSLEGTLIMKFLPKDCDISANDTIVTSGHTGVYPKGILIGSVVGIRDEYSELSKYAVIKPAVDLAALEEVLIIMQ